MEGVVGACRWGLAAEGLGGCDVEWRGCEVRGRAHRFHQAPESSPSKPCTVAPLVKTPNPPLTPATNHAPRYQRRTPMNRFCCSPPLKSTRTLSAFLSTHARTPYLEYGLGGGGGAWVGVRHLKSKPYCWLVRPPTTRDPPRLATGPFPAIQTPRPQICDSEPAMFVILVNLVRLT